MLNNCKELKEKIISSVSGIEKAEQIHEKK